MSTTMKQDEQDQERKEREKRGGKKMDRLCRIVE
jgi:hypothetical protein